jgi:hypothetical protein
VASGKPIGRAGYCALLRDQGDRDALKKPIMLRGLAQSMVVKFADYWRLVADLAGFKRRSQLRMADVDTRTVTPRDPTLTRWGLARSTPAALQRPGK